MYTDLYIVELKLPAVSCDDMPADAVNVFAVVAACLLPTVLDSPATLPVSAGRSHCCDRALTNYSVPTM